MTVIGTMRQKHTINSRARLGLLVLVATLSAAATGLAQSVGDAQVGRDVAASLCSPCHQIDGVARDPNRVPPGFGAIADMASQTELSLRVFLQTPHGDMPRYQLSKNEIDDIIAYILSLRGR